MQRGSHAGKAEHCSWAPQSQSYRFVSNTVKRPVVTSVLGASGVIIGHTGWAPSRKCDPAALGLCVAQRLPSGTSVTAPIQLRITFVVLFLFQLFTAIYVWTKAQPHPFGISADAVWKLCDRPAHGVFPRGFCSHKNSSHHESLMQLVFISFFESIFMSALWGFLIHVYLKCDVFHFWNQIFIPANNILESHLPALSCLSARLEPKNLSQNKSNKPWQV